MAESHGCIGVILFSDPDDYVKNMSSKVQAPSRCAHVLCPQTTPHLTTLYYTIYTVLPYTIYTSLYHTTPYHTTPYHGCTIYTTPYFSISYFDKLNYYITPLTESFDASCACSHIILLIIFLYEIKKAPKQESDIA